MTLTFKSSTPEERVIIERNSIGAKRVARAVQSMDNPRSWDLSLEHPSGMRWNGTFHGDGNTVQLALTQMMMERENEFKSGTTYVERRRDLNVRIMDDGSEFGNPTIKPYGRG